VRAFWAVFPLSQHK